MNRALIHRGSSTILRFSLYAFALSLGLTKAGISYTLGVALIAFIIKKITAPQGNEIVRAAPVNANRWIWIFLAYCAASLLWSDHLYTNFRGLIKHMRDFFIFYTVLDTFQNKAGIKKFIHAILLGALITSFNGIFQFFYGSDLLRGTPIGSRITSTFNFPTALSSYFVLAIPLSLIYFLESAKEVRWRYLLAFSIFLFTFLLAFTRSTLVSLSIVSCLFILLDTPYRQFYRISVAAAILVLMLFLKISNTSPTSIIHLITHMNKNVSVSERIYLWKISRKMIQDKPILGHGLNSYSKIHVNYFPKNSGDMPYGAYYLHLAYPHNSYLKMWVEMGLLGMFLYSLIFISLFSGIFAHKRHFSSHERWRIDLYLIAVIAFLFSSLFDSFLISFQLRSGFWAVAALMTADWKLMTELKPSSEVLPSPHLKDAVMVPAGAPQT